MNKVRTRFAPSPTGKMHVGSVRTAIFAWAWAKKNDGEFILRIEDTDKAREVAGAEEHIMETLGWLGLDWQEGPDRGGKFRPYKQSDRLDIYRSWAQKLIDKGLAYADPYSREELEAFRQKAKAEKIPFLYRNHRPDKIAAPKDWYKKLPLRFKVPGIKRIEWHDEVRGKLSAGEEALDDFVLIKADGYPTYNFAHVIDDYLMKISHVMRGEEFISSTPKFIALHEALELPLPKFATMPPILGREGGKKLSKRDGAKDVLEYRLEGYLSDSVVNYLASLGWNDGTEKEIYTPEQITKVFSLQDIQKKGARFDLTKLDWIDWRHYLLLIDKNPTQALISAGINKSRINQFGKGYIERATKLASTKSRNRRELLEQMEIFIAHSKFELAGDTLKKIDKHLDRSRAVELLNHAMKALDIDDFTATKIEAALRDKMEEIKAQPREFLNLVRWSISNRKVSPDLFAMLAVLGKEESLKRIKSSIESAA